MKEAQWSSNLALSSNVGSFYTPFTLKYLVCDAEATNFKIDKIVSNRDGKILRLYPWVGFKSEIKWSRYQIVGNWMNLHLITQRMYQILSIHRIHHTIYRVYMSPLIMSQE